MAAGNTRNYRGQACSYQTSPRLCSEEANGPRDRLLLKGLKVKNLLALFSVLSLLPLPAAALNVFACEPEWASLAQEIGGVEVKVYAATTAMQDPHRIEARPSLIAKARQAELVACTGAELETGWLPMILQQAGNTAIQPGRSGYFEAALQVERLDVPTRLDRAQGDVHAAGNPHVQLDPRNIAKIADALGTRMAEIDAAHAALYRTRLADFQKRWAAASERWTQMAKPLSGVKVVAHHENLNYLWRWLAMPEVGTLEPKPGMPPTAHHLAELAELAAREKVRVIAHAAYEDPKAAEWLANKTALPAVTLPFTVGGEADAKDLFALFDVTLKRLLAVAK